LSADISAFILVISSSNSCLRLNNSLICVWFSGSLILERAYACNNSSIVEHSSKVLGVTKQIKSVENCKYHPNARVQGKRMPLDMLMVEQNIGRYLTRHEVVYHIDGDDLNNQLDNLM
jgi:hypothetical protein